MRKRKTTEQLQTADRRLNRIPALLCAALLLLSLCSCSSGNGRTESFHGFVVRTEKDREETKAKNERPETEDAAAAISPRSANASVAEDYVINKSSNKFHYPWCSGVKDIKESNRMDFHGTRETVINMGCSPCKNCNP